MYAAYMGEGEIVEALLDAGAQLDSTDCQGFKAVHYARIKKHTHVERLLASYHQEEKPPSRPSSPPFMAMECH